MDKRQIVRNEMKRRGLDAKELAELLRVSEPSVNRWVSEKGGNPPDSVIFTLEVLKERDELKADKEEFVKSVHIIKKYF